MNALEIAKNIEVQGTRLDAFRPTLAETREVVIRGGEFGVPQLGLFSKKFSCVVDVT
jgi:hypothetical protein